jgi:hypothetical protein
MLDWFANNLMQANPDKFQALAIGKNTFKEQICFDLNGSKIKCEMPCYRTIIEVG